MVSSENQKEWIRDNSVDQFSPLPLAKMARRKICSIANFPLSEISDPLFSQIDCTCNVNMRPNVWVLFSIRSQYKQEEKGELCCRHFWRLGWFTGGYKKSKIIVMFRGHGSHMEFIAIFTGEMGKP